MDGKKVDIGHTKKWVINENDINKAKQVKESVDVIEVEEKISKQDLMNELMEGINKQNKKLINESIEKVTDKIDQQNKAIQELMEEMNQIK
ncbi:MAG: hypothetical protein ACOCRX_04375 [Candidatus Woesearchaeota archaeon]